MRTVDLTTVVIVVRRGVYVAVVKDGRGVATGSTGTSNQNFYHRRR